jgi:hypothetical protein
LASIVAVLAGSALWLGPPALDALRAVEARVTGRPELVEACSFRLRTGLPCLGCGGTRALAAVARAELRRGFATNPLGASIGLLAWVLLGSALTSFVLGHPRPLYWAIGFSSAALPLALLASAFLWWQAVRAPSALHHPPWTYPTRGEA